MDKQIQAKQCWNPLTFYMTRYVILIVPYSSSGPWDWKINGFIYLLFDSSISLILNNCKDYARFKFKWTDIFSQKNTCFIDSTDRYTDYLVYYNSQIYLNCTTPAWSKKERRRHRRDVITLPLPAWAWNAYALLFAISCVKLNDVKKWAGLSVYFDLRYCYFLPVIC